MKLYLQSILRSLGGSLLLILALLSSASLALSQALTVTAEPKDLPDELCGMALLGSSANGRYLYGHQAGKAFVLDTKTDQYALYGDDDTNYEVVGVSADGWALLQGASTTGQSGLSDRVQLTPLDSTGGERSIYISSPDAEYPFFTLWHMTSDAKYFCGTLVNEAWTTIPIIGERNAEGTAYSITKLPIPDKDPLGTTPQQFRLIHVSEDGAILAGFLVEQNGYVSTIMTYKRQADGSYTLGFPANSVLFDLSVSMPPYPEYEDYVTVPNNPEDPNYDEEKLREQEAAYDAACNEYNDLFIQFTRNLSMKQHSLSVGAKGRYAIASVVELGTDSAGFPMTKGMKYLSLDLQTGKAELIDLPAETSPEISPRDYIGNQKDLLCALPMDRYWNAYVYTHDKQLITLVEWIKRQSGKDFTTFYTIPDPFTEKPTLYTGWPTVSQDGRTVTIMGYPDGASKSYRNSYLRFGESILPLAPVCATEEQPLSFDGERVHTAEGSHIYLFDIRGQLLYQVAETNQLDLQPLRRTLAHGSYLVVAIDSDGAIASLKVSL